MRTDSDLAQLSLIRAGAGIGICQAPLADGIIPLQRVLAADFSLYLDTWLVMHEDLRHSPACKRVFDFSPRGCRRIFVAHWRADPPHRAGISLPAEIVTH